MSALWPSRRPGQSPPPVCALLHRWSTVRPLESQHGHWPALASAASPRTALSARQWLALDRQPLAPRPALPWRGSAASTERNNGVACFRAPRGSVVSKERDNTIDNTINRPRCGQFPRRPPDRFLVPRPSRTTRRRPQGCPHLVVYFYGAAPETPDSLFGSFPRYTREAFCSDASLASLLLPYSPDPSSLAPLSRIADAARRERKEQEQKNTNTYRVGNFTAVNLLSSRPAGGKLTTTPFPPRSGPVARCCRCFCCCDRLPPASNKVAAFRVPVSAWFYRVSYLGRQFSFPILWCCSRPRLALTQRGAS